MRLPSETATSQRTSKLKDRSRHKSRRNPVGRNVRRRHSHSQDRPMKAEGHNINSSNSSSNRLGRRNGADVLNTSSSNKRGKLTRAEEHSTSSTNTGRNPERAA